MARRKAKTVGSIAVGVHALAWKLAAHAGCESAFDVVAAGCSLSLAGASVVFAGYMLAQDNHVPRVNGMQYLAIFAKPRAGGAPPPSPGVADVAQNDGLAAAQVDQAPTGSIARSGGDRSPVDRSFRVIGGQPDLVWAQKGQTIRAIRVGDVIGGAGQVAAIANRKGAWRLLDRGGVSLLRSSEAPGDDAPAASRFSRRLIFDAAP